MTAIRSHSSKTIDANWDGPANERRLSNDGTQAYYRRAYAWQDSDEDPESKSSYRFIHHKVDSEGEVGAANVTACRNGIAVLNGARGGTTIPDEDRRGVYNHLSRHMRDADVEPPELKSRSKRKPQWFVNRKNIRMEIKAAGDGTFEGWLSRYNEIDFGRDLVEPGAFTKTIQQNGGVVPLLWQHDDKQPIGVLELEDKDEGLWVRGRLLVDEVKQASEAYALIREGVIKGLSIGYKAVRKLMKDGVRRLKEIALFEGSLVTFPMLSTAQVESIKGQENDDFISVLEEIQMMDAAYQMLSAVGDSLFRITWDYEAAPDEKAAAAAESIEQFEEAFMEFLPRWLGVKKIKHFQSPPLPEPALEVAREAVEYLKAVIEDAESGTSRSDAGPASKDAGSASVKDVADASEDKAVAAWLKERAERGFALDSA